MGWPRRTVALAPGGAVEWPYACGATWTNCNTMRQRILDLRTVCGLGGGPEKTLLNSPRYLEHAYEMRLAYIRPERDAQYDMPSRALQMGVDLVDIPERGPLDVRTIRRLYDEVRRFKPALLHAHDYKTNLLALLLGHWFRIPVL